jgi:RNA polymerase sigma factor (sigma-70 family)
MITPTTINELFIIYKNNPKDYEVVVELHDQIIKFISYSVRNRIYNNEQLLNDIINECNYELWKSISGDKLDNFDISKENYSLVGYIKRIINSVLYKRLNNSIDTLSLDVEFTDSDDSYIDLVEDTNSITEMNCIHIIDNFIDILMKEDISKEYIEWLLLSIEGKSYTEIGLLYDVSTSFVSRTVKKMQKLLRNKREEGLI